MENENPEINQRLERRVELEWAGGRIVETNRDTVFEIIRDIRDPEHPYTLEQLNVVSKADVSVGEVGEGGTSDPENGAADAARAPLCTTGLPLQHITVVFTPTVPHCSMASIIGLAIVYQLMRYTDGLWIRVYVKEHTHTNSAALNKQLNDKDRVLAALENEAVVDLLNSCAPSLHDSS